MADEEYYDEWDEGPSKSAVKREMTALQDLGTRLTQLPESQLKQMPIEDERLREAVDLARRIKHRSGLRRQLQYIGKLMRSIDPDPIIEAFARIDGQHQDDKARFHRLEAMRDDLLKRGDKAMDSVLAAYPDADRQQLRQWIRQHQAETKAEKPPTSARKLFRYLRELDEAAGGGAVEPSSEPGTGSGEDS